MSYDALGPGPLDYLPCRYGASRLLFRGPKRDLGKPFIAFIGATETYGKFISTPFPALIEEQLGVTCANFGQLNAGIDVFAHDPFVLEAASKAEITVIQIMGAQNMTNRFYSVHPRRNDRLVGAATLLQTIYREVDFADFHFTKHMLSALLNISPDRFNAVRQELQEAWKARMRLMLRQISGKIVLLYLADHMPARGDAIPQSIGNDPLFVTREMLDEVAQLATHFVEVVVSREAMSTGTDGMLFDEMETAIAEEMLNPAAHLEAAEAVLEALKDMR